MVIVTPRQIFEFLNYRGEEYQSHVEMLHQEDMYLVGGDDGLDDMSFPYVYMAFKTKEIANIFCKHHVQDNDNETVLDVVDEVLRYQTDGYRIHTWFGGAGETLIVAYRPTIRIRKSIVDEVSIPIRPSSFWFGKGLSSSLSQEPNVSCPVCNKAVLEPEFWDSDKTLVAVGCPECGNGFPTVTGISKHGPVL